jgi:hypothetical protein
MNNNSPKSVMMMNDISNSNDNDNDKHNQQHLLSTRSLILNVGILTGRLCSIANTHLPPDTNNSSSSMLLSSHTSVVVVSAISDLFQSLMQTANSVDISLPLAISKKLVLNNKKYPVELCKVSGCEPTVRTFTWY